MTLKEALFILNPSNYIQNDCNSFRQKFMKCNDEKLVIDEVFWDHLNETFGTKRMAITRHLRPYDFYFNWTSHGVPIK